MAPERKRERERENSSVIREKVQSIRYKLHQHAVSGIFNKIANGNRPSSPGNFLLFIIILTQREKREHPIQEFQFYFVKNIDIVTIANAL